MSYLNPKDWLSYRHDFLKNQPFNHIVIDDFFTKEVVDRLVEEFPANYDASAWSTHYNNPIENKKTCNQWDRFPEMTYQVFSYLCGSNFVQIVEQITARDRVFADIGLHGGGWHAHTTSGKLNIHLDYNIHPKLKLQRHYNLIVYVTPEWNNTWGGGLELWTHDPDNDGPLACHTLVENKFNRAVLFDTTQNSWHGLPEKLTCPWGIMRQSLAVYYLTEPAGWTDPRNRALFAPYKDQVNDAAVIELIKQRSQIPRSQG